MRCSKSGENSAYKLNNPRKNSLTTIGMVEMNPNEELLFSFRY